MGNDLGGQDDARWGNRLVLSGFGRISTISSYRSIALRCCIWALLIVGVTFAWSRLALAEPADRHYTLGVFPYVPPLTLDRIFGPVAVEFAKELHRSVHLRTKSTFEKFTQEMQDESYDIIFVYPFFIWMPRKSTTIFHWRGWMGI